LEEFCGNEGWLQILLQFKEGVAELIEWASNERKCCPFLNFDVDSEREGSVLCLQLAGDGGIKPFIRSQFLAP